MELRAKKEGYKPMSQYDDPEDDLTEEECQAYEEGKRELLRDAEAKLLKAENRIAELEKLAYLGEHHFPENTYKYRLVELQGTLKALRRYVSQNWLPDKFDDPDGNAQLILEKFNQDWDAIVSGADPDELEDERDMEPGDDADSYADDPG